MNKMKNDYSVLADWDTFKIKDELELLKGNHFVVVDIETTGLSPDKGGRITEIGAVRIRNGQLEDTFSELVNPGMKIPAKIVELTGITDDMVKDKRSIGQVLPDFYQFLQGAVIVCHNAKFDWKRFLLPGFKTVGIQAKNKFFCTMEMFKKADNGRGRGGYTLSNLTALLDVNIENHHRAVDDAVATAEVVLILQKYFVPENVLRQTQVNETDIQETTMLEHTPVNIKRVSYWEKQLSSKRFLRRQYVNVRSGDEFGTVFYDIASHTWYNKDFPLPLDFKVVEGKVLQYLHLSSRIDFEHFKGVQ